MQVVFNPKDPNTFASASLDRTVKVWGISSNTPHFTLEGHEKGVNCVDYFTGGDKPFLITGADDRTAKIWDYQSRTCVQTLEGHTHNVACARFHPDLPLIITGSEDGSVRLWHTNTYRLENTLNYGFERVWSIGVCKGSNKVALGFDEGSVLIKLGREEPVASMSDSKIIWARHNTVQTVNARTSGGEISDGERLSLGVKELGSCEVYPQTLQHSTRGRNVVVCGDNEYIIYTALAWRNKSFGNAVEFVWHPTESGDYAIRESFGRIKLFKNFQETKAFTPSFTPDGIFGGHLLGARCSAKGDECIFFYSWDTCQTVCRVDVPVKNVFWSENGDMVCISSDTAFFILRYNQEGVDQYLASGADDEDGYQDAFEVLHEFGEKIRTGRWLGDCFVYTNSNDRLNYCVGGKIQTLQHLERRMYLLGYFSDRLYLIDKEFNVVSFELLLSVLNYKTLIVRDEFEAAEALLPKIPKDHYNSIARFLEAQDRRAAALAIATDPDYRFELAVQLGDLDTARSIVQESESEAKWKQLGDLALSAGHLSLASECLTRCNDINGLLLIYASTCDAKGLETVAELARTAGRINVAFIAYLLLRQPEQCVDLLLDTGRSPEAAFMARAFCPSLVSRVVEAWRADLQKVNKKAAESLADPTQYPNLFPDFDLAGQAEARGKAKRKGLPPARLYATAVERLDDDLIQKIRELQEAGELDAAPAEEEPEAAPQEAETADDGDDGAAEAAAAAEQAKAADKAAAEAEAAAKAEAAKEAAAKAKAEAEAEAKAAAEAAAKAKVEAEAAAAVADLEEPDFGDEAPGDDAGDIDDDLEEPDWGDED